MNLNTDLITVSLTSEKFSNLEYDGKPLTLEITDLYSHFGISHNEKYDNYSLPVDVPDELFQDLKSIEEKVTTFLEESPEKNILRSLVEKGKYKTLYLRPNYFDKTLIGFPLKVSGQITVTAVFHGVSPTLLVRCDNLTLQKCERKNRLLTSVKKY